MREQAALNFLALSSILTLGDEKIADYALTVFVNEERVAENTTVRDRGVSRKKFCVHIAQNHLRRPAVIPAKQIPPHPDLVLEQGTQVVGGKMSEIKNFHAGSPLRLPGQGSGQQN